MLQSPAGLEGINTAALCGASQSSFRLRNVHIVTLYIRTLLLSQLSSSCRTDNIVEAQFIAIILYRVEVSSLASGFVYFALDVNNSCRQRSYCLDYKVSGFLIVDLLLSHQFFISSKTFRLSLLPKG